MQPEFQLDPKTRQEFEHLLNEMQRVTGAEMPKVVRNAGRDLVFRAVKYTPLARKRTKKNTKLKKYSDEFDDGTEKYWVTTPHRYSNEIVRFPGTKKQAEKYNYKGQIERAGRHAVENRGYAKAGWLACLPALGITPRKSYPGDEKVSAMMGKFSNVNSSSGGYKLLVQNLIPFIEDMNNGDNKGHRPLHILEKSMRDVNKRMTKTLEKLSEKIKKEGKF